MEQKPQVTEQRHSARFSPIYSSSLRWEESILQLASLVPLLHVTILLHNIILRQY